MGCIMRSGVFEGERAYAGHIFRLREHTDRLIDSAASWVSRSPTRPTRSTRPADTLAANNMTEAYLRPLAWRGSEQLSVSGQNTKIHLAIACWAWPAYFDDRMAGIKLNWAEWRRPDPRTAPTARRPPATT